MSSRQEKHLKSAHDRSETLTKQSLLSLDDYPVKIKPLVGKAYIIHIQCFFFIRHINQCSFFKIPKYRLSH